jgi:predicted small lipoprotein YifL
VSSGNRTRESAWARRLAALLILMLPLTVGACGKKGPLRLPEAPASTPPPDASPDAEDEAK